MKTKLFVLIGATTLASVAMPLWADPSLYNDQGQRDRDAAQAQGMSGLGDLKRASQIIGSEIKDDQGRNIGRVRDLGLDLQNGRITEVIVATGGSMGMHERFAAVPPQSLICESPKALRLKADADELKNAPEFDLARWDDSTKSARIWEAYHHFSAMPYFANEGQPPVVTDPGSQRGQAQQYYSFKGENAMPRLGQVVRASKLMGATAWNIQGEKLGRVDNFVADLQAGRLVEVVLAHGGFLGMGGELCAIPPQAFRLSKDNNALGLDTTKEALKSAPHFKASEWSQATQPGRITEVYTLYHVNPYFVMRDIGQGGQNVRERSESVPSPLEQANKADLDITAKLHRSLMDNDKLSVDAKNVKIVTSDGRVTLIGPVNSAEEKRLIGEAAGKIVSGDKVDNQLEVHATPIPTAPTLPDTP